MKYDYLAPVFAHWARKDPAPWRLSQLELCRGRVLEAGVGAGNNLPYYTRADRVDAVDISPKMLQAAETMAKRASVPVSLHLMDVAELNFPSASFDTVSATFVFCSVRKPIIALTEVCRVLRPGGEFIAVEHLDSHQLKWKLILHGLKGPLKVVAGCDPTRDTLENVRQAGLVIKQVEPIFADFVLLIRAGKA